jgi:hypothetical protein
MTTAPPVAAKLYALLAADATLATALAQPDGSLGLFREDELPPDAAFPYCIIGASIGPLPYQRTLAARNRIVNESRGVSLWFERSGDAGPIDEAAWRVSTLLDYCQLDLSPHRFVRCRASVPAKQPSDQLAFGRRVNIIVRYQEG